LAPTGHRASVPLEFANSEVIDVPDLPSPIGFLRDPRFDKERWIFYAALIGIVSGIGAIGFDLIFRVAQWGFLQKIGHFMPPGAGGEGGPGFGPTVPWMLIISLVLGALLSGAIVFGFAPEAEGHGTDAVVDAFHNGRGKIRRRVPIVKSIASAITIGSGGSGGREGPIAQIGAGFGSFLADALGLTNHDRRVMMMAGAAGGIGAIFRAPLGATFFGAEILYGTAEFEYEVLIPALIASVTSYSVYASYAGWGTMFSAPPLSFEHPKQLAVYVVLGLACAAVGAIYPRFFYGLRDRFFHRLPIPQWLKPAVGAGILGLIALRFPEALGMGYGYIQQAVAGHRTATFLLALCFIKIIATSLTISSGGSGGVFGPSLVIGGALGGSLGLFAAQQLPAVAPHPAAAILVGMGGFFAGVARVPFAAVIMVMEMTGSYGLLVPSLVVAAIAFVFVPKGSRLYEKQVPRRADSPVHLGSFAADVLAQGRVGRLWEPSKRVRTVPPGTTLEQMIELSSSTSQRILPVVDSDSCLLGEVSIEDIRRALVGGETGDRRTARELMVDVPEPLVPGDDLARAARLLAGRPTEEIPVVSDLGGRKVIGTFSRSDLIVAYGRELERIHGATRAQA
jgi:chloride channel protein, CIC family